MTSYYSPDYLLLQQEERILTSAAAESSEKKRTGELLSCVVAAERHTWLEKDEYTLIFQRA